MKKHAWYDKCGHLYLVYVWSKKYNRFVNTHAYENERDAALTIKRGKH